MAVTQNAWDSVNNPQQPTNDLWGKVEMKAELVGLVKGIGKEPYDSAKHKRPWTNIDLFIDPLPELEIGNLNVCNRNMLAESREWSGIVLKSIHDLGIQDARELIGKFVRVETTPTGETYVKDGVTKERTAFKFVHLFASEDECRQAYLAEHPNNGNGAASTAPAVTPVTAANERDTALKFLTAIVNSAWKTSGGNYDTATVEIATKISALPLVSKHFAPDAPEITEMLMSLAMKVA